MRVWKGLGLAAFAGVTATGVVIARAYTPQEIRERLQARLAETPGARDAPPGSRPSSDQ